MTGPNDSSFAINMSSSTSVKTVGCKKKPEMKATFGQFTKSKTFLLVRKYVSNYKWIYTLNKYIIRR